MIYYLKKPLHFKSGQMLVELLVAIGLMAIIIPALLTGFVSTREGRAQQVQRLDGVANLKEIQTATRNVRERDWNSFAVNGTYHPVVSGSQWTLVTGSESLNGYTRQIVIADTYRDASGNIASSGGTLDPSTKKVTATISWNSPRASSIESVTYMTRNVNATYAETTEAEFNNGTKTNVDVTNTSGGEVVLGDSGRGDWCLPNDYIRAELDLPQNSAARDVKAIEGKAFTGTNASGTGSFVEINVSNAEIPVATIDSQITGYQTNDVFISGNYAYVATGDISKDVVIIDLTTNQEVGYYNDSSWFGTAQGVFVVGNVGYATIGLELHTFDLSSKTGSRPVLDTVFLWGSAYRLYVVGNYAFIAVDFGSTELRLVNVSNSRDIRLGAKADVNGSRGQEVYVNDAGTRAYLATSHSTTKNEFFIIDTSTSAANKNSSSYSLPIIGSYNSSGMDPNGVTVGTGNKAILVGTNAEEYQVIDITSEASPTRCGGLNVDSGIYGVSSVLETDGDAFSYVTTGDSTKEFKVIEGGVGGGTYVTEGTFISQPRSTSANNAYNSFTATVTKVTNTDITMQVGVADQVSGNCNHSNYLFLGPDGTTSTYYTESSGIIQGSIPYVTSGYYVNPARCFQYKVYLSTTNTSVTPTFLDTTINYSP